jgi:hypothetical protein
LAGTTWARRAAEAAFRAASRRHLARCDKLDAPRCQARTLLGLLHQAQSTPFGRDHDFRRIRTVADYRRLVPLAEAPPVGTPLPGPLHAAHRAGWRTTLALVAHALPKVRLFGGSFLLLDEAAVNHLPRLLRPYTRTDFWAADSVTWAAGPAERFVQLFEELRVKTGKDVRALWPNLSAVLYTAHSASAVERLRAEVGPGVSLLETVWGPGGPIAVEDPRHGGLRLLPDHGVYFEFVPPHEAGPRLGLDEIEPGETYELVLTSPAGLWSCRTGRAVCFEGRGLSLLRFAEMPAPVVRPRPAEAAVTPPAPPPHRRSAGTVAVPPESFVHNPWSALAGRG